MSIQLPLTVNRVSNYTTCSTKCITDCNLCYFAVIWSHIQGMSTIRLTFGGILPILNVCIFWAVPCHATTGPPQSVQLQVVSGSFMHNYSLPFYGPSIGIYISTFASTTSTHAVNPFPHFAYMHVDSFKIHGPIYIYQLCSMMLASYFTLL